MPVHITSSGATDIGLARAIKIQVNKALTGTITVTTAGSTLYGTAAQTIGISTDPGVVLLQYGGLHGQGSVSVNPSATTDITVTKVNKL